MSGESEVLGKLLIFVFSIFLISSALFPFTTSQEESNIQSIEINGNDEFINMANESGWPGNGTEENPFIIEGYNLTPIMGMDGIIIQNTTLYFIIRNSTIYYAYNPQEYILAGGIKLVNVTHAIIENVTFNDNEVGSYIVNSTNITVRNCRFYGGYTGVFVRYGYAISVNDNYFEKGEIFAGVLYSNNVTISNNTAYDYKDTGISLSESQHIEIAGNYLTIKEEREWYEFSKYGIYISGSESSIIADNKILGNHSQRYGIWANGVENIIKGNAISGNTWEAFETSHCYYYLIEKNNISFNAGDGIYMVDTHHTIVRDNNITYNYEIDYGWGGGWIDDGIKIDPLSEENIIVGNLFAFNGLGIYLDAWRGHNLIYNNSFYYNARTGDNYYGSHSQAVDKTKSNSWNTSKYGNYWRDWASQNDSNGDGIVDKPYPGVRDMRPLKNPPRHYEIEPTPPRNVKITGGVGYLNISWLWPIGNGTSPLNRYKIYRNNVSIALVSPDTFYYNDTTVKNGEMYEYYITAVNAYGESIKSNVVSGIPGIPSQPLNVTAYGGNKYVYITWKKPVKIGVSSILYYNVYRVYPEPPPCPPIPGWEPPKELLTTVPATQLYYNDTNVTNGYGYDYAISAVNSAGEGPLSDVVGATPGTIPSPPLNLTVIVGDGYVNLTWQKPKDDGGFWIEKYRVYRNGVLIANVSSWHNLYYNDTNLTKGVKYTYYVTAVNYKGESEPSNEVNVTIKNRVSPISSNMESLITVTIVGAVIILVVFAGIIALTKKI